MSEVVHLYVVVTSSPADSIEFVGDLPIIGLFPWVFLFTAADKEMIVTLFTKSSLQNLI